MGLAHGHDLVVRHGAQIIGTESDQRLRSTGCGNEFDTNGVWALLLDNGTQIAAAQVVGR